MKKLLFSVLFVFACCTAQAQIADGSIAPDFTVTDLNGTTHTLSEYLAQGKTVIIDVSATWCGPCWSYHNSGALYDLHYVNGQGGSGDVVVLFVEGDGNTPVQSLYGISDVNDTWGDWTKHSAYPIIDSAALAELYEVAYYPTIFRICPDGKTTVLPQYTFTEFQTNISENCGVLTTVQNHGKLEINDQKICEGSTILPEVLITNFGSDAITAATVELRQGDTVLAEKNFTGTIGVLTSKTFSFDAVDIDAGTDYEAVITSINGAAPTNMQTASHTFDVIETAEGGNNLTVKVYTSYYPAEMSWAIKNSNGTVVASGGPYQAGTEDNFGGGGADANTTKLHNIVIPGSGTECYSVEFYSSTSTGWLVGDTPHGIEIFSGETPVFSQFVDYFGSVLAVPAAFKTNGTLGNPEYEIKGFSLFPNPTTGIINFMGHEAAALSIIDITGKTVYEAKSISDGESINLMSLQKGVYIARIDSGSARKIEKIIIN